ncbi:hypothetical protein SPRG_06876 [Saprolegnia parasitica CBS 223.65]|uniref:Ricin B lectin domain-containing protein n=1 Tax=Saprolegnia parasitica (strain CBS 223.65) TaxID=695850 RepID=A0A067CAT9_SAPPC|nr:hypothetical protein SPRG_06876 [Saprolegnia parasitica CBS 223.65]KDO27608.1 hypothetical protein SPRG_06876 [Saprolegnia parasitica CBS 223.65]|eukprot:XP_012201730.1 hypothetical protein SPRG_06876 [Saprolegnia parasitica CBS 223.65]
MSPNIVPLRFCTSGGQLILSEFYGGLYVNFVQGNSNERFDFDATNGFIISKSGNTCLTLFTETATAYVRTDMCTGGDAQKWSIAGNAIKSVGPSNYCLTYVPGQAAVVVGVAPCNGDTATQYFGSCDQSTPPKSVRIRSGDNYLSEFYTGLFANTLKSNRNEVFRYDANAKTLQVQSNLECLDVYQDTSLAYHLHTYPCNLNNGNQKWIVTESGTNRIQHYTYITQCLVDKGDTTAGVAPCDFSNDTSNNKQLWTLVSA